MPCIHGTLHRVHDESSRTNGLITLLPPEILSLVFNFVYLRVCVPCQLCLHKQINPQYKLWGTFQHFFRVQIYVDVPCWWRVLGKQDFLAKCLTLTHGPSSLYHVDVFSSAKTPYIDQAFFKLCSWYGPSLELWFCTWVHFLNLDLPHCTILPPYLCSSLPSQVSIEPCHVGVMEVLRFKETDFLHFFDKDLIQQEDNICNGYFAIKFGRHLVGNPETGLSHDQKVKDYRFHRSPSWWLLIVLCLRVVAWNLALPSPAILLRPPLCRLNAAARPRDFCRAILQYTWTAEQGIRPSRWRVQHSQRAGLKKVVWNCAGLPLVRCGGSLPSFHNPRTHG